MILFYINWTIVVKINVNDRMDNDKTIMGMTQFVVQIGNHCRNLDQLNFWR